MVCLPAESRGGESDTDYFIAAELQIAGWCGHHVATVTMRFSRRAASSSNQFTNSPPGHHVPASRHVSMAEKVQTYSNQKPLRIASATNLNLVVQPNGHKPDSTLGYFDNELSLTIHVITEAQVSVTTSILVCPPSTTREGKTEAESLFHRLRAAH